MLSVVDLHRRFIRKNFAVTIMSMGAQSRLGTVMAWVVSRHLLISYSLYTAGQYPRCHTQSTSYCGQMLSNCVAAYPVQLTACHLSCSLARPSNAAPMTSRSEPQ